jgi:preprotein translocase subunit SecG
VAKSSTRSNISNNLFGAKGPAGFMAKFTFIIATLFIVNTLTLGYFYNQDKKVSIAEDIKIEKSVVPSVPAPVTSAPAAPEAPASK